MDLPPTEATRIGQILRQSRTQKAMTAEDVSNALHLQVRQIEAIEKGDYSTFSSQAIVRGHLRSFARLYGLDGNNLVHLFESSAPQQKSSPPTKTGAIKRMVLLPGTSNESVILGLLLVVIASLFITLSAYLWTVISSRDWSGFFVISNVEEAKTDKASLGVASNIESSSRQTTIAAAPELEQAQRDPAQVGHNGSTVKVPLQSGLLSADRVLGEGLTGSEKVLESD